MNFTPVDKAFDYTSTLKPEQINPTYSNTCIYCNNVKSIPLLQDGSFRQCLQCRKHFRAQIIPSTNIKQNLSQNVIYKKETFQTLRPNYLPIPIPESTNNNN